jgi:hypothetical protein
MFHTMRLAFAEAIERDESRRVGGSIHHLIKKSLHRSFNRDRKESEWRNRKANS